MPNTIVRDRQSTLDVAIQESGSVEAAVKLAADNGMAVTDRLFTGQLLTTDHDQTNAVVATLEREDRHPATDYEEDGSGSGIGWMITENTFIVAGETLTQIP